MSYKILRDEAKRMSAVNSVKYRLADSLPDKYHYFKFEQKPKKLALKMPVFVFCMELIMSGCVLVVLGWKYIIVSGNNLFGGGLISIAVVVLAITSIINLIMILINNYQLKKNIKP